jgi:porphobilinogen synthase
MHPGRFPATRLRRNRRTPALRAMVAETRLSPADLIWPVFLCEGEDRTEPVATLPGVSRHSVDRVPRLLEEAAALGIPAVALFPNTPLARRAPDGAEALNPDNLVCRALRAGAAAGTGVALLADVALDPYTSHGHDGLLDGRGEVLNDETVAVLARQAVVQAEAGADILAPSDMMDGRVAAIRAALDEAGHHRALIMAYAAKYASGFYGPFRDAVGASGLLRGDKRGYQMDPANAREAMAEIALDLAEGADSVMVKPGLAYLDVIARAAARFDAPVFAYSVSGEYAMIEAAAAAGMIDRDAVVLETLTAFRRAGAAGILTYHAPPAARLLRARGPS